MGRATGREPNAGLAPAPTRLAHAPFITPDGLKIPAATGGCKDYPRRRPNRPYLTWTRYRLPLFSMVNTSSPAANMNAVPPNSAWPSWTQAPLVRSVS